MVNVSTRLQAEILGEGDHCRTGYYPPKPAKPTYCATGLLNLVVNSENSYVKSDKLSAYAESRFNIEILPQLKLEEVIYFTHFLKEKAIDLMEEAQKPEIVVEYTGTEENNIENTASDDNNNDDTEGTEDETPLDGLSDALESAQERIDYISQGLEKAQIITSKVNPSNTGFCRKGRSLNIYSDLAKCAVREFGNEIGFIDDSVEDEDQNEQQGQQQTVQQQSTQQQNENTNMENNAVETNEEMNKLKKKTKRVQGLKRAVKKFKGDNPDQSFDARLFRQNTRSEVMKFDKVVKMKMQFSNYNTYVAKKKKITQKITKAQGIASNVGEGVGQAVGLVNAIESGDALEIASSAIGMISFAAAFFPPVGTAIAAIGGAVTSILGLFGSSPSDAEIIGGLIEEQTAHIEDLIEGQTEILLKSLEKLAENQAKLAENIVKEILTENYFQMMDDIHGVNTALKMKKEHINLYKDTCILSWTDISNEMDMQEVNSQFGRIGSYMSRFCANRPNIGYCGELIFQYVLMASLRDMVIGSSFLQALTGHG